MDPPAPGTSSICCRCLGRLAVAAYGYQETSGPPGPAQPGPGAHSSSITCMQPVAAAFEVIPNPPQQRDNPPPILRVLTKYNMGTMAGCKRRGDSPALGFPFPISCSQHHGEITRHCSLEGERVPSGRTDTLPPRQGGAAFTATPSTGPAKVSQKAVTAVAVCSSVGSNSPVGRGFKSCGRQSNHIISPLGP